uniref:Uncharacterized protein n=2 Tax=Schistosoma mansoni TaxID=6183 RepID=A0AA82N886_SCHMA
MLATTQPGINSSYIGPSDILSIECISTVSPDMVLSGSDSTSTVVSDVGCSENTSSIGNSILTDNFLETVISPIKQERFGASSKINSPLSIQKSLENIKVQSHLKPSSYMNITIQKNNSLPPSPKLLQKPTVKQGANSSPRSPTMTGPNFRQTSNLTNTKTKYASSNSANASPNLVRKPLSYLSKSSDIKK